MPRDTHAGACPTSRARRVGRAILAVALVASAATTAGTVPWLAVVLTLAAAPIAFGAIIGRCPIDFVRHRRPDARNTLGIAVARQPIDLGPKE